MGLTSSHFQPCGQFPVLFMSSSTNYAPGVPIRGGIPICFPWFGPHPSDADAPSHGLVRTQLWDVIDTRHDNDGVEVSLGTQSDGFSLRYSIRFGNRLQLKLLIQNETGTPQECEVAPSYVLCPFGRSAGDNRRPSAATFPGQTEWTNRNGHGGTDTIRRRNRSRLSGRGRPDRTAGPSAPRRHRTGRIRVDSRLESLGRQVATAERLRRYRLPSHVLHRDRQRRSQPPENGRRRAPRDRRHNFSPPNELLVLRRSPDTWCEGMALAIRPPCGGVL